jgi:hypothetical protein
MYARCYAFVIVIWCPFPPSLAVGYFRRGVRVMKTVGLADTLRGNGHLRSTVAIFKMTLNAKSYP